MGSAGEEEEKWKKREEEQQQQEEEEGRRIVNKEEMDGRGRGGHDERSPKFPLRRLWHRVIQVKSNVNRNHNEPPEFQGDVID